jgi:long-chain acyl-CoA synthetase
LSFSGWPQDDVTLAPGPLAASLNLYALAECLYAGSEFHTLESFDVGDVHAAITTTASPGWCWCPPCCGCSANAD